MEEIVDTAVRAAVKVGEVYESKKPKRVGFMGYFDDRQIIHVSEKKVLIRHDTIGYNQDFIDWCSRHCLCSPSSEFSQLQYEAETKKDAKIIEAVWDYAVQYDSPTVKDGKKYPTVSESDFLKWAGREVTKLMPKGTWRS